MSYKVGEFAPPLDYLGREWVEPADRKAVLSAVVSKDLSRVQNELGAWRARDPRTRVPIELLGVCLAHAIEIGHVPIITYLLSQHVPFNLDQVQVAIWLKSQTILQLLLDHGWNINQPVDARNPPLLRCVRLLYELAKQCVDLMDHDNSSVIDDQDLSQWFLAHGAGPNATAGVLDITPLSVAIASAPFFVIEMLFQYGGSTQRGQLLHYAAIRTNADHIQVLNFLFARGATGINLLMYENIPENFELMKSFGLGTPLHAAAKKGLLDVVKYLLNRGANPSIRDTKGQLAQDCARRHGHSQVVDLLSRLTSPTNSSRLSFLK